MDFNIFLDCTNNKLNPLSAWDGVLQEEFYGFRLLKLLCPQQTWYKLYRITEVLLSIKMFSTTYTVHCVCVYNKSSA